MEKKLLRLGAEVRLQQIAEELKEIHEFLERTFAKGRKPKRRRQPVIVQARSTPVPNQNN